LARAGEINSTLDSAVRVRTRPRGIEGSPDSTRLAAKTNNRIMKSKQPLFQYSIVPLFQWYKEEV
jgi:hypothetical protein